MIRRVRIALAACALVSAPLAAQQPPAPPQKAAVQKAAQSAAQQAAPASAQQAAPQKAAPAAPQKVTPPPQKAAPATTQKAAPGTPQKAAPATTQKAAPSTPQKAAPATTQKAAQSTPQKAAPATAQKAAQSTPQKAAPSGAGKAPAGAAAPGRATPAADSARIVFSREVYNYPSEGRRDPFGSLIATGDVRPLFNDLQLTGIMYDPSGRNSLAMMQDVSTNELYRARVGSVFGRIRVTAIREKQVMVAIDEFGFTRQEVLSLNAPSPAGRTP